tara:strand:+ start:419 stop:547 length:129 start_codon:yes stop_codon:yes gene_type:complete
MIKKTILIILCLFFLFSCGKKSDPEYQAKKATPLLLKFNEIF